MLLVDGIIRLRFNLDQHQAAHHLQQSAPFIAGLLGRPHPEIPGLEPITLKVEAFAIASGHFLKDLAIQNLNHPLQSRIDMLISVPRGAGHLLHQGLQLLLSGSDPISQDLAAHLNQVAAHLDRLYVEKFQRHNPSYDPNSPSSSVGKFMGEMLLLEGGALALRGTKLIGTGAKILKETAARRAIQEGERLLLKNTNRIHPEQLAAREIQALKTFNRSKNPSYITFIENGETKALSVSDLSHAGTLPDKGLYSKAGRALQKHSERLDSVFAKPKGSPIQVNSEGQKILDEILDHPNKIIILRQMPKDGSIVIDVYIPGKHGARFSMEGDKMIGFLEPKK